MASERIGLAHPAANLHLLLCHGSLWIGLMSSEAPDNLLQVHRRQRQVFHLLRSAFLDLLGQEQPILRAWLVDAMVLQVYSYQVLQTESARAVRWNRFALQDNVLQSWFTPQQDRRTAMASTHSLRTRAGRQAIPPLENGDRLDQRTFHERYEAMPAGTHAELIEGIVYMASPQKLPHSDFHVHVVAWLVEYWRATPGTRVLLNPTLILANDSEPQPDACLLIRPEKGGQSGETAHKYLQGAPELVAEIAWSSESIDLHAKKRDYEGAGVREYVVIALRSQEVFWFQRHRGRFRVLEPDGDDVLRSRVFPGLWLDASAFLREDEKRVLAVLRQGLAAPEHAAFVTKLAAR